MSDGWQPRETAPSDGKWLFGKVKGCAYPQLVRRIGPWMDDFEISDYGLEDDLLMVEAWAPIPEWMLK